MTQIKEEEEFNKDVEIKHSLSKCFILKVLTQRDVVPAEPAAVVTFTDVDQNRVDDAPERIHSF